MLAVIELSFDPLVQLGQLTIRWQTIGATVALLVALAVAARHALRSGLSLDDMLLILVGIVPGAVVGGRLFHVVTYLDAYLARPIAVVDPRVGGLSLLGAVLGGMAGALYVMSRTRAPAWSWAAVAALPLLLAVGLGKGAQLLGGSGQGVSFDGLWAVAFLGPGPWVSAGPAIPAHPSQVYEGLWLLVGAVVLTQLPAVRRALEGAGRLFIGALVWFLVGRVVVGFTWRDPALLGPLNAEQVLALIALGVTIAFLPRVSTRLRGV